MELNGKVALVTGAARGIGKAIAIELAKNGAKVIGADIDQTSADTITNFLKELNLDGHGLVMNVTDQASIESGLATMQKECGAPNILVNNAGITRDNLMLRMKQDEWDAVIATNLTSVFKLSQACLRDMVKARWGRIINIASVVGITGNPGQANYTAAKAGVIALSKTLALEIASRGITVNNIAPGYIDTQMTQRLTDEQRQSILNTVPMRIPGTPEDVANAVAFLASNKSSYITGQTIHVNGGMYMA